jgi:uncharacterized Zn finger protein (UPF0148 family)
MMDLANRLAADDEQEPKGQQEQKQAANNHDPDCTCPICKNTKKEAAQEQAAPEPKEDEQKKEASRYASLKALVIHTAAADDNARRALMPVLQGIKNIG